MKAGTKEQNKNPTLAIISVKLLVSYKLENVSPGHE